MCLRLVADLLFVDLGLGTFHVFAVDEGGAGRTADENRFRSPIDPLVMDPGLTHLHRPSRRGHLPRLMGPIANHQPESVAIHVTTMRSM